jgi:lipoyl(octanoyl) transferase
MASRALQVLRLGTVDYTKAWELQREIHEDVVAGRRQDTLVLLQHEPVYTAGRRTQPEDRPVDCSPVIDVDRGGRITWHGPGQLVGYPILRLPDPVDVVGHVRRMEGLLLSVCDLHGVRGRRVQGRSGVWVGEAPARKIAAVGVRVARGVTMHGFALNVSCDLDAFERIVPCGIRDAGVTSLEVETGAPVAIDAVADTVVSLSGMLTGGSAG